MVGIDIVVWMIILMVVERVWFSVLNHSTNAYATCWVVIQKKTSEQKVLMTGADGCVYNQRLALELAKESHIILLCGHFKGIDERVREYIDGTVSIGDYVLSGGELPALVIIDSLARLLPGAVSDYESISSDSHYAGLLEHRFTLGQQNIEGMRYRKCYYRVIIN